MTAPYEISTSRNELRGLESMHQMPSILRRGFFAVMAMGIGVLVGSFVSSLMLYIHYPETEFSVSACCMNGVEAFLFAPFSMTIGVFPTIGFYGWGHGGVALLGMLFAGSGLYAYFKTSEQKCLMFIALGGALWANNNYLSWSAIMSV